MKRLAFAFMVIIPQLFYAQRTLSDRQWIEDLDFMIKQMDSIHPNLQAGIHKEQLHESARALRVNIPMLGDEEIMVEMLKMVTVIHDGHTRLHGRNLTKKWYPLRIEKFSDGYFITAIAQEYSDWIGARVLMINDQPAGNVFDMLKEITSHDNAYGQEYFAPLYFTMSSILSGLHIVHSPDDPLVLLLNMKGRENEVLRINPVEYVAGDDLSWYWKDYAVPASEFANILGEDSILPLYLKKYNQPFWFELINKNTVYFAYNECANDEGNKFEDFNKKLWTFIDTVKPEFLVIDLRNNLGGSNSHIMPLVHEILRHDDLNKKGKLFIITGKKTFSAAMCCAAWIEYHCNPIFAGEPTGAGPNHYADPDFSYLPNSKVLLMISKYHWQNSWPWDNRICIEPEIKVDLSSVDYFNYKDPVMDEILRYTKQIQ